GVALPDAELRRIGEMAPQDVASMSLTNGRPPLHLREARLPPVIEGMRADMLPVLVQVDMRAKGFGPWSGQLGRERDDVLLVDPIAGRVAVPASMLEDHLAGVMALYRDPAGLTGLAPKDAGEAVRVLQRRLSLVGEY